GLCRTQGSSGTAPFRSMFSTRRRRVGPQTRCNKWCCPTRACSGEVYPRLLPVTRGLDPRVHLLRMKIDCRVKPGNDVEQMSTKPALSASVKAAANCLAFALAGCNLFCTVRARLHRSQTCTDHRTARKLVRAAGWNFSPAAVEIYSA